MRELVLTAKFRRAYKKFVGRDKRLQKAIDSTLIAMSEDLFTPSLGAHKLSGVLAANQPFGGDALPELLQGGDHLLRCLGVVKLQIDHYVIRIINGPIDLVAPHARPFASNGVAVKSSLPTGKVMNCTHERVTR